MFESDEDSFETLFDRLVPLASVKHSLRFDDTPVRVHAKRASDPSAMEVDTMSKGRGKETETTISFDVQCATGSETAVAMVSTTKETAETEVKVVRCSS